GTTVAATQAIKVYVSSGPATVTVPDLSGQSQDAATAALTDRGFEVGAVNKENSGTLTEGTVIGTSPEAGTAVKEGETIDLLVSSGLVTVPDVRNQPFNTAIGTLQEVGLTVNAIPDRNCSGQTVTGQDLAPGEHPQRSTISITYCAG